MRECKKGLKMNTMTLYRVQVKASAVYTATTKSKLDEAFALAKAINEKAFKLDKMEDRGWFEKQLLSNELLELIEEECNF